MAKKNKRSREEVMRKRKETQEHATITRLAWEYMHDGDGERHENPGEGPITIGDVVESLIRTCLNDRLLVVEPPSLEGRRAGMYVDPSGASEEDWALHRSWKEAWYRKVDELGIDRQRADEILLVV